MAMIQVAKNRPTMTKPLYGITHSVRRMECRQVQAGGRC
jgi:hypothetical protein